MRTMELSVIVPTYNETDNIRPLVERLTKACQDAEIHLEIVLVDDQSTGTAETEQIVSALQKEAYPVRIHCRKAIEGRGLSSAVLLGFQQAQYTTVLCMDADLQHEPEAVPSLALPVLQKKEEFTIGSRYCAAGGMGFDWALHRRLISWFATFLASALSSSSDPMSGFFCTTQDVLHRGLPRINPIGFKIGLEAMVRCRAKVKDIPITFRERIHGESKLTMKQNVQYLQQLLMLYWDVCPFCVLLVVLIGLAVGWKCLQIVL